MYEIVFSDESLVDIFEIEKYISLDSVVIAKKVVNSILGITQNLSMFPQIGVKVDLKDREVIDPIYKYKIRYRIE
jgi:plasmid stabilization system protein ParE